MISTSEYTVGQKVWMQSGPLFKEAMVTEITEKYVMVEPILGDGEKSGCQPSVEFKYDGTQALHRTVWGSPVMMDSHNSTKMVEKPRLVVTAGWGS